MALPPNMVTNQDMPPKGGYPNININRWTRTRGPSGTFIWGALLAAMVYGGYQISCTNYERRMNKKEARETKMAIYPFLQVEQDVKVQKKIDRLQKEEYEVMKDVPGWEMHRKTYGKRWTPPLFAPTNPYNR